MIILFLEKTKNKETQELKKYLKTVDEITNSVDNTTEALSLIEKNSINLVFVDLNYHSINPYQFIQSIKVEQKLHGITIVGLLTSDDHYNYQKALISGCSYCLTKPYITNYIEIKELITSSTNKNYINEEQRKYIAFSQKLILELEEKISHLEDVNESLKEKNTELKTLSQNLDSINDITNKYIRNLNEIELSNSSNNLLLKLQEAIPVIFGLHNIDLFIYNENNAEFINTDAKRRITYNDKFVKLILNIHIDNLKLINKHLELPEDSNAYIFIMQNKSDYYRNIEKGNFACKLTHKSLYCKYCLSRYLYGFIIINNINELDMTKKKLLKSFINQSTLIYEHKLLAENLNSLYHSAEKKAITDALTEIFNKRFFIESLEQKFYYSKRTGSPLSLIMIDIDFFKKYNDKFGHPTGDILLKKFAGIIKSSIRRSDIFARYGGEEFAIITPGLNRDDAAALAEKLRSMIEKKDFNIKEDANHITASFGVASVFKDLQKPEELIENADKKLYEAKKSGRNMVC